MLLNCFSPYTARINETVVRQLLVCMFPEQMESICAFPLEKVSKNMTRREKRRWWSSRWRGWIDGAETLRFLKGFQTRSHCFPASASLPASRGACIRLLNCSSLPLSSWESLIMEVVKVTSPAVQSWYLCVLRASYCSNLTSMLPAECLAVVYALTWTSALELKLAVRSCF